MSIDIIIIVINMNIIIIRLRKWRSCYEWNIINSDNVPPMPDAPKTLYFKSVLSPIITRKPTVVLNTTVWGNTSNSKYLNI